MDQTNPQNFLVIVDTSIGSSSAFNAACRMIQSLNIAQHTEKKNVMYLVHLSNLKSGFFTSTEKKEEQAKAQERSCKSVLAWFGRRCCAYGIPFTQIGVFSDSKSSYVDKINMLVNRFEIGAIFVGTLKVTIPMNFRSNVFRINRRMGTLPDKTYLKEIIHGCDFSNLKSFDETTGISSYEAKLETDFVQYRFVVDPQITENEKALIVTEIYGEPPKTQPTYESPREDIIETDRKEPQRTLQSPRKKSPHKSHEQAGKDESWKHEEGREVRKEHRKSEEMPKKEKARTLPESTLRGEAFPEDRETKPLLKKKESQDEVATDANAIKDVVV